MSEWRHRAILVVPAVVLFAGTALAIWMGPAPKCNTVAAIPLLGMSDDPDRNTKILQIALNYSMESGFPLNVASRDTIALGAPIKLSCFMVVDAPSDTAQQQCATAVK